VRFLNEERPRSDWLSREYCQKRQFFTRRNAEKIDACRARIREWTEAGLITRRETAILLASLINSIDKVANTAGTYYAFLKGWDRKALRPFKFELIPFTRGNSDCHCFLEDAKDLVSRRHFDLLYLDPPHNERHYDRYYHLPETLALQETPKLKGRSGIPSRHTLCSEFTHREGASSALESLISKASFRVLLFHYSDNGLIQRRRVQEILATYGKVKEYLIDGLGYTTTRFKRKVTHRLYVVKRA
jgi:adenine-specific DNA-methyltransferase